jgi:hypothetical protein
MSCFGLNNDAGTGTIPLFLLCLAKFAESPEINSRIARMQESLGFRYF